MQSLRRLFVGAGAAGHSAAGTAGELRRAEYEAMPARDVENAPMAPVEAAAASEMTASSEAPLLEGSRMPWSQAAPEKAAVGTTGADVLRDCSMTCLAACFVGVVVEKEAAKGFGERFRRMPPCCRCCFVFVAAILLVLALIWLAFWNLLFFGTLGVSSDGVCTIQDFDTSLLPTGEAMIIGTHDNVVSPLWDAEHEFDLTGLWWLKWEETTIVQSIYMATHSEIVISFAGSKFREPPRNFSNFSYPQTLLLPGAGARKTWGYGDNWMALYTMAWHALSWKSNESLGFTFVNKTHATLAVGTGLGTGTVGFQYLNKDQWLRPNLGGKFNYRLTRIVDADGVKTKYWAPFEEFMRGYRLRTWNSTASCQKLCESVLREWFQNPDRACRYCRARHCAGKET